MPALLCPQLETLHGAKNRFIGARMTLDEMKKMPEGTPILVPLNGSLYAPGSIANPEKVIVELGTGYFCEKVSTSSRQGPLWGHCRGQAASRCSTCTHVLAYSNFPLYPPSQNLPDAKVLIDRKMVLVDKSIESIETIGNKKRKNLEQIMQVLQWRMQQAEQQGGAQAAR